MRQAECHRLRVALVPRHPAMPRTFSTRDRSPYEFKDVDEFPEYNDYIAGLNGGKRVMPTIRINNETLINPDLEQLGAAVQAAEAS